jgi:uncharacterized protein YndB with AHSA1/START domain
MHATTDTTTPASTDRIEKQIHLRAPVSRVWRALTDAQQFSQWFRVKLDGDFAPHAKVKGQLTHPGYEHLKMELAIDRIEPERYFSYRWHPYAVDPKVDYSSETPTLVEFRLTEQAGGTLLTVTESGFDRVPLARRAEAFRMNSNGWAQQLKNIEHYVAAA